MAIQIIGSGGNLLEVDANKNAYIRRGIPVNYGAAGGAFAVTGGAAAIVAAAIAANTPLATLRLATGSALNAYITRLRFAISPATVGASGGVPGQIGWQRFTAATPTGGTARTPARKDLSTGGGTNMTDVRDSNAALTVTGVTFGDVVVQYPIPNYTTGGVNEFVADLDEDEVIRLTAGDGLALRVQVAGPATMTWIYSYSVHWLEK